MSHDEIIAVIAHHRDGGLVQYQNKTTKEWEDIQAPCWAFNEIKYRRKPRSLWAEIMPDGEHIQSSLTKFEATSGGEVIEFKEVMP